MSLISKPWKLYNKVKNVLTGGSQKTTGTGAINKVEPNVPVTKGQKIKRDLKLATQKRKASEAKLDNTIFRINQEKKKLEEMKATGGRVGRKFGSPNPKKTNVQKIKETFAPKKKLSPKQMKIAKLAGNKNKIDAADFKKLRNR